MYKFIARVKAVSIQRLGTPPAARRQPPLSQLEGPALRPAEAGLPQALSESDELNITLGERKRAIHTELGSWVSLAVPPGHSD